MERRTAEQLAALLAAQEVRAAEQQHIQSTHDADASFKATALAVARRWRVEAASKEAQEAPATHKAAALQIALRQRRLRPCLDEEEATERHRFRVSAQADQREAQARGGAVYCLGGPRPVPRVLTMPPKSGAMEGEGPRQGLHAPSTQEVVVDEAGRVVVDDWWHSQRGDW